jgi:hypothetical protein
VLQRKAQKGHVEFTVKQHFGNILLVHQPEAHSWVLLPSMPENLGRVIEPGDD